MRELDFNLNDNPFINFHTSRYAMSARVNVEKAWKYCKEDDTSFFIMSLGCVLNAVNSVPQLRRRIIDGKVIEYDYLDPKRQGGSIFLRDGKKRPDQYCEPFLHPMG